MDSGTQTNNLYTQLLQLKCQAEQLGIQDNNIYEEEEEQEFEETINELIFESEQSEYKSTITSRDSMQQLKQSEYDLCFSRLDDIKIVENINEPDRMEYFKLLREYEELKEQNIQYYSHIVQLNALLKENLYKYNNSGLMEYEDEYSKQIMIQRRNLKIRKVLLETLIKQYLDS